jgi:hypothetical protein
MSRHTRDAWRLLGGCLLIAAVGVAFQRNMLPGAGAWPQLVVAWLYLTPLWAVATAWLSRDPAAPSAPELAEPIIRRPWLPELLRLAMCAAGLAFLAALAWAPSGTWIPLVGLTWALGIAADAAAHGAAALRTRLLAYARRALAALLVFQYVCLAWIFFRATSFDNALAVLRQIALVETDHANLVPIVTTALAAGATCHLFADGSFRWLRRRFVGLPPWAQGAVLAGVALVLRALGHTKIVPFIYFQF